MSEPNALENLKALCPMGCRDIEIGAHTVSLWTACDIDPLLDRMLSRPESDPAIADEQMPYWAELWPSSVLMAEVMVRHHPKLPEGVFLELGCGPALPSIVAARLGKKGRATDYLKEAGWLARANLEMNRVEDRVEVRQLDWREPPEETFPWILAGDVVYEKRNFSPILHCWDRLLSPGGQVWLAEPGRSIAKAFFDLAEKNGWRSEIIGQKERVNVFRFTRREL